MSHRIVREEVVAQGRWLIFKRIHYIAPDGVERVWEAYERTLHGKDGRECDAVEIIPLVITKERCPHVVLVSQFRPAAGKVTIEFPAGLVDEGETAQEAALRELYEETGFVGTPVINGDTGVCVYNPGTSNTTGKLVCVMVDGNDPRNANAVPHPDEGEFVSTHLVPLQTLHTSLDEFRKLGLAVDARLSTFATTMQLFGMLASQLAPSHAPSVAAGPA